MNYAIFLDTVCIFKLSHVVSTKGVSLWMETFNKCGKRSVVWKNIIQFEKAKQFFENISYLLIEVIETSMKSIKLPPRMYF